MSGLSLLNFGEYLDVLIGATGLHVNIFYNVEFTNIPFI